MSDEDLAAENARLKAAATHGLSDENLDLLGVGTEDEILERAERLGALEDALSEVETLREQLAEAHAAAASQTPSDGDTDGRGQLTKLRNEAKNLRQRLRDTEAERDQVREAVTGYHRAEAVRIAGEAGLRDGEDLFRDGTDVSELLGEDGRVDPEAVNQAVRGVAESHPHWLDSSRGTIPDLQPGTGDNSAGQTTWSDILSGNSST